jgi:hypothetical protein
MVVKVSTPILASIFSTCSFIRAALSFRYLPAANSIASRMNGSTKSRNLAFADHISSFGTPVRHSIPSVRLGSSITIPGYEQAISMWPTNYPALPSRRVFSSPFQPVFDNPRVYASNIFGTASATTIVSSKPHVSPPPINCPKSLPSGS